MKLVDLLAHGQGKYRPCIAACVEFLTNLSYDRRNVC